MIYVTGDTHNHDPKKSTTNKLKKFIINNNLSKQDILIITGDVGFPYYKKGHREHWNEAKLIHELSELEPTILLIDGNNDNHNLIDKLYTTTIFSNTAHMVSKNIFYLKRGHIYNIDGKTFWCMGGGSSVSNPLSNTEYSLPTLNELNHGIRELVNVDNKVDFILTHTAPLSIKKKFLYLRYKENEITCDKLEGYFEWVNSFVKFKTWISGHIHIDNKFINGDKTYYSLYDKFLNLNTNKYM